jgi:hypothetical protein
MDEKSEKILSNYLTHAQKYVLNNKKEFSSFKTIYHKFIKNDNVDPVMDYTKEIIKRMERDKISSQASMQISESIMPEMQNMKKDVIFMALPFVIGFISMITSTAFFSFSKPLTFDNPQMLYSSIGMFISTIIFGFGMVLRNKIKFKTLTKSMIFQACTAYTAAKMQGQGSFGAFRILEEMKHKQGKELQIRVNQPKIVYKR